MKTTLFILLIALGLGGCIREDMQGCPSYIWVSFYLNDAYELGSNDTKIANQTHLYQFEGGLVTAIYTVPYEQIKNGKSYRIDRMPKTTDAIDFVSWSVPFGDDVTSLPTYKIGDSFAEIFIEHEPLPDASGRYKPIQTNQYIGRLASTKTTNGTLTHRVEVSIAPCRIEVNVTDNAGLFSLAGAEPSIDLRGVMTKMNLGKAGVGKQAIVHTTLRSDDPEGVVFKSGRFGVLPSAQRQTVAIDIYNGATKIATLNVPNKTLEQGAKSGGLLIFNYTLGISYFELTVDGFTQKIEIVQM